MIQNKILLTSLPRSGSTWVLKMLSINKHVVGLHEPDHLDAVGVGGAGVHPYIRDCQNSGAYYRMYRSIFGGMRPVSSTISRQCVRNIIRQIRHLRPAAETLIVKSVFSLHNTEWIFRKFSPQVVVLLRHPCSVIHSIHRKWPDARLQDLLSQPALVNDHLLPYVDTLKNAASTYEMLASRVASYYKAVLNARASHPSWIFLTHEELCEDPLGEFKKLYNRLGLTWNETVGAAINQTNRPKASDDITHVNRFSSSEIDKWKRLLSAQEIAEIANYYCPFEVEFYRDFCRQR